MRRRMGMTIMMTETIKILMLHFEEINQKWMVSTIRCSEKQITILDVYHLIRRISNLSHAISNPFFTSSVEGKKLEKILHKE